MGDIFTASEASDLLYDKYVMILGDSNFRSIYKDLVQLVQSTKFISTKDTKAKGELSFKGDDLLEGGRKGVMHNGTGYREKRLYQTKTHKISFEFITRVFNDHVQGILKSLTHADRKPDILIVNSALWDMTRYGSTAIREYKKNVCRLFKAISASVPESTLVISATAPPISSSPSGGVLVPEVDFLKDSLRMDIICANFFVSSMVDEFGFDMVDLHFFLRQQIHRRVRDGIHWDNTALRRVVNVFLTHIAEAWGEDLPGRVNFRGEPKLEGEVILSDDDLLQSDEGIPVEDVDLENDRYTKAERPIHEKGSDLVNNSAKPQISPGRPYSQNSIHGRTTTEPNQPPSLKRSNVPHKSELKRAASDSQIRGLREDFNRQNIPNWPDHVKQQLKEDQRKREQMEWEQKEEERKKKEREEQEKAYQERERQERERQERERQERERRQQAKPQAVVAPAPRLRAGSSLRPNTSAMSDQARYGARSPMPRMRSTYGAATSPVPRMRSASAHTDFVSDNHDDIGFGHFGSHRIHHHQMVFDHAHGFPHDLPSYDSHGPGMGRPGMGLGPMSRPNGPHGFSSRFHPYSGFQGQERRWHH